MFRSESFFLSPLSGSAEGDINFPPQEWTVLPHSQSHIRAAPGVIQWPLRTQSCHRSSSGGRRFVCALLCFGLQILLQSQLPASCLLPVRPDGRPHHSDRRMLRLCGRPLRRRSGRTEDCPNGSAGHDFRGFDWLSFSVHWILHQSGWLHLALPHCGLSASDKPLLCAGGFEGVPGSSTPQSVFVRPLSCRSPRLRQSQALTARLQGVYLLFAASKRRRNVLLLLMLAAFAFSRWLW